MDWLTLSEASAVLGIHPITLRSWVDRGIVRAYRTPGGHRRFLRGELQEFVEQQRTGQPGHALDSSKEQALARIRTELGASPVKQAPWYNQLSDAQRAKQREMGQRILGLLVQYVSRGENAHGYLQEARELASEYGAALALARMRASDLARGFLFFRQTVIHATYHPEGTHIQTDTDGVRLLQRINSFMDEVLIATLEAYDRVMEETASPGKRKRPLTVSRHKSRNPVRNPRR